MSKSYTKYLGLEIIPDSVLASPDPINDNAVKLDDVVGKMDKNTSNWDKSVNAIKHIKNITLQTKDWNFVDGYYKMIWKNTQIDNNTQVNVNFHLSSLQDARYIVAVRVVKQGEAEIFARVKPLKSLICDITLLKEVK